MKPNNITVCVPSRGCTRDCPYCISKMTPAAAGPARFGADRIELALRFAQTLGAASLLVTSRGEPLCNADDVLLVLQIARRIFLPAELQTNGDIADRVGELAESGLRVYAVSIDSRAQVTAQADLFAAVVRSGLVLRWTVALHDDTLELSGAQWLEFAATHGVRQLSFRNLTAPDNPVSREPADWIATHVHGLPQWMAGLDRLIAGFRLIRTLSFGPRIYKAGEISLTYFPYCIQESGNDDDLRSLIVREDGHVYTDWNSLASVLF
jgi:hypothetical protein